MRAIWITSKSQSMKSRKRNLIGITVIITAVMIFSYTQNNCLSTSSFEITSDRIPQEFHGYRIVQLSDLHGKWFGKNQDRLVRQVEKQKPNLIVMTGDLVDASRYEEKPAIALVQRLSIIAPVYVSLGNHEEWSDVDNSLQPFLKKLQIAGARIVRGESLYETRNGAKILISGIDDPDFNVPHQWQRVVDAGKNTPSTFHILLSHRPELFDKYVEGKFDLVFTGHAHGGQIRLPFVGGLVAPVQRFFPHYDSGLFAKGQTAMIVNRGLGNSIIPQRIFNQPEIVCVQLRNQK